jgi:hypothetical protein
MRTASYAALCGLLALGACKTLGDIPTSRPLGFVTVATGDAVGGVHRTSPSAYFVNAVNVSIPQSQIVNDACVRLAFPSTTNVAPLTQIAAGPQMTIATTLDTAQLLPAPADINGYIIYRLAANDSIRIVPKSTIRVTIPGATDAFDPYDFTAVTADSLFVQPVDGNPAATGDLPITWNAQTHGQSSIVIELEYNASAAAGAPNEQVLCSFDDDGTHTVDDSLATHWRTGNVRHVHAYRWITTTTSNNASEVVVLSSYATDSTHIIVP